MTYYPDIPFSPIQAIVDHASEKSRLERAESQMTLGRLIDLLTHHLVTDSQGTEVTGFGKEMSYRGYYSDLAFEPSGEVMTAVDLLGVCQDAMGKCYQGYKGGDFYMIANTPLWISPYGYSTGDRLMGLTKNDQGVWQPITEKDPELTQYGK